jgi:hypothetical protein
MREFFEKSFLECEVVFALEFVNAKERVLDSKGGRKGVSSW